MTYLVFVSGQVRFCHVDHLRSRSAPGDIPFHGDDISCPQTGNGNEAQTVGTAPSAPGLTPSRSDTQPSESPPNTDSGNGNALRRSTRTRRFPERLNYDTFSLRGEEDVGN